MRFAICFLFVIVIMAGCGHPTSKDSSGDILVTAEGKKEMILLTDRPPNLETPLKYFLLDYTPNDVFFVRWHLPVLPNHINEDTFRLRIHGAVDHELALSINDLKTQFTKDSIVALAACAGNARSFLIQKFPAVNGKTVPWEMLNGLVSV
jgi:DMSO/TMAO reductase YedYZ molybdopterin-dependent catalytic subunit